MIRFADWRRRRFQPKALAIGEDELLVLIGEAGGIERVFSLLDTRTSLHPNSKRKMRSRVSIPLFKHKSSSGARTTFQLMPGGGFRSVILTIKSKIPLEEGEPGFDACKAADLHSAVVEYCKSRGNPYREVYFEQDY